MPRSLSPSVGRQRLINASRLNAAILRREASLSGRTEERGSIHERNSEIVESHKMKGKSRGTLVLSSYLVTLYMTERRS